MYYLQSRYYDPAICRFINADSFASTGQEIIGTNMYAYCGNNPVSRIDESGSAWLTTLGIGVLVTGISGLASGISSVISGGDFWAGFAAGAIAGVVGYGLARVNLTNALLQVGARVLSSIMSNLLTTTFNGNEITVESALASIFDAVMDGVYSTIGSYYNPFSSTGELFEQIISFAFSGGMDGLIDVLETYLFNTPNSEPSPAVSNGGGTSFAPSCSTTMYRGGYAVVHI